MASMPPQKWGEARAAIFDEIERFKHAPVRGEELEKARRQIERAMYRELETMEGQAANLGYYQLLGDYRLADRHREAVSAVSPEQLVDVARRYFHPDNCSLVSYLPEGVPAPSTEVVESGMRKSLSSDGGITETGAGAHEPVNAPADTVGERRRAAKEQGVDDRPMSLFRLDNGVRVLLKRRPTVPMVSILTVFPGGSRYEPAGKSGLATLTHRAVIKGTENYGPEEITERIESLGGNIESFGSFDSGGVYMSVLSEHLDGALEVYNDVVRRPRFDGDRVAKEKERALQELAKRHDNPVHLAMDALFRDVFGDHPYAWPFFGERGQAAALAETDCAAWYQSLLVPESLVVTLVGDVDEGTARRVTERLLGDMPAVSAAPSPVFEAGDRPVTPGIHVLRKRNLKQAVTFVGYTAPPMLSDDAVALDVLNGVLSGLGGRLFVELRDKRSLGYMTGSALNSLFDRSIFFGYANPAPDRVDEAVDVIQAELDKVTKEVVTEDEFERSREWLIGSQLMQLQRNGSQANAYGTYEALGFGYGVVDRIPDLIREVTREKIRETAQRVFVAENAAIVKLLPEE
jgi:zinc protease